MVLTKAVALEYLSSAVEPVTAKALSIDRDSRASTASELLERMTAQGLCARDPKQRPREYALTDAGRRLLPAFRSGTVLNSASPSSVDVSNVLVREDGEGNRIDLALVS